MKSKWYELKDKAIVLRKKQGFSIGRIERQLGIPRSTLSGWFANIKLTTKQQKELVDNRNKALIKARKKAVIWHNTQKQVRIEEAKKAAENVLKSIDTKNKTFFELAMAFLYLGEGSKKNVETAIGSSDPEILKFFLAGLKNIYNFDLAKIKCELYLRADQDSTQIKRYWSKTLGLPLDNFKQVNFDKRTEGTTTYDHYKGVCNLKCGNVAIQRRLVSLANLFCRKVIIENLGL